MIKPTKLHPHTWLRPVYIASKLKVELDDEGNEIVRYSSPVEYKFTVNTVTSSAELAEFGERAGLIRKIVVPIEYENLFKEFDVAYIDTTPVGEARNGSNADYMLKPPRVGNNAIVIYIEKILGK